MSVLLSYTVMTCSGLVVAAITLPFAAAGSVAQYFWILFLIPVGIAVLSPPVLNRLLRLVLRVSHQPALGRGVSYRGLARTMAWALCAWAANGLMIYVLMRQLAGDGRARCWCPSAPTPCPGSSGSWRSSPRPAWASAKP